MLTIGDYYYALFPLRTMGLLAYNESKVDTRKRNIAGYVLSFLCSLALILIDLVTSGKGGIGNYISICVFVAGFGVADAHVQGGMVGDLSFMNPEFTLFCWFGGIRCSHLRLKANYQSCLR